MALEGRADTTGKNPLTPGRRVGREHLVLPGTSWERKEDYRCPFEGAGSSGMAGEVVSGSLWCNEWEN